MTNAEELVTHLEGFVRQLRAQADRHEQAIALLKEEQAAPKAKRGAREEQRPTRAGRKAGNTRHRVMAYLKEHPTATAAVLAKALGIQAPAASYHLAKLRKA